MLRSNAKPIVGVWELAIAPMILAMCVSLTVVDCGLDKAFRAAFCVYPGIQKRC